MPYPSEVSSKVMCYLPSSIMHSVNDETPIIHPEDLISQLLSIL